MGALNSTLNTAVKHVPDYTEKNTRRLQNMKISIEGKRKLKRIVIGSDLLRCLILINGPWSKDNEPIRRTGPLLWRLSKANNRMQIWPTWMDTSCFRYCFTFISQTKMSTAISVRIFLQIDMKLELLQLKHTHCSSHVSYIASILFSRPKQKVSCQRDSSKMAYKAISN